MPSLLTIPDFGRIDDWNGVLAIEPNAYREICDKVMRINWTEHLAAGPPKPISSLEFEPVKGGKSIAKISVVGPMTKGQSSLGGTSTIQTRRDIRAAAIDPNVSGIMLQVDSPGGSVNGMMRLANDIRAARAGANGKPVYVWVDDMAASAAYWMSAGADMIFADNKLSQIGSIGVYQVVYDLSKKLEAEGVKANLFTTGPLKGLGAPGVQITDDQAGYIQAKVNEVMGEFESAVRRGRGMTQEQIAAVNTGAMFSAQDAMRLRLIDGIKTREQVVAALAAAS